ncbi:HlyD family efflux transporter periplasmic adaptor subunit [Maribius pontilimi]|uniref:HlyD family efflux transporter periplasmic adaptor subunit n=1 Tax=Palleronia pontilimi TaxID=1964209 RepID=A0A934IGD2_9RHOB|nr:HlyD family efflux transporter periplasmic adaptor subunit [Palleronia pontilimi]MBJ3761369.1 HlyD family efflux transporter periplasmic adaptor subunit [Palleronia pontilimi]
MRFFTRALSGLFLLALTVGFLATAGGILRGAMTERAAREAPVREAREQVFAAPVVTLEPSTIVPVLDAFGEIASRRTLEVRAVTGGRVVGLGDGVEDGGRVTEGQLLFQIDPREAERARAVRAADLQDAEAALDDAERAAELAIEDVTNARDQLELRERAAERQRDLADRGIGSTAAVETGELAAAAADQALLSRRQALAGSQAEVAQARTALERARIAMSEAERVLADTRVTAAFSGVLSDVTVVEGGVVTSNEKLALLLDPDALEVAFRVSAGEYTRLLDAAGRLTTRDVTVQLEAGGYTLASPATISRESAQVGEGRTGRQLFARLAQPEGFRAGDFVLVAVQEPALDAAARLPVEAVTTDGRVLVLGDEDRLEEGQLEILRRQGDSVIVRVGDLAGREVVTERSPSLGVGIKVRPLREAQSDAPDEAAEFLELSDARRARLVAFVEGNERMPEAAKQRVLAQLKAQKVPAGVVARIEGRMGG